MDDKFFVILQTLELEHLLSHLFFAADFLFPVLWNFECFRYSRNPKIYLPAITKIEITHFILIN